LGLGPHTPTPQAPIPNPQSPFLLLFSRNKYINIKNIEKIIIIF